MAVAAGGGRDYPEPVISWLSISRLRFLLIVLVLILIGAFPAWPHSKGWGYAPSGGIGLVVLILVVLLLTGRL